MIPKNIYEKYHMNSLENELELFGDNENTRRGWYETFLIQTDHIPNKIIESLVENLADATALNFIAVFVQFLADVRIHYSDVLKLRKQAREEINRLEGGTEGETS